MDYSRFNRSVERAIGLLLMVCQSKQPMGLTEISREAGLDKATTRRLLSSLTNVDFLQQEPETRRYTRGAGVFSLWPDEVGRLARPHLEQLTEATGETACLIMPSGVTKRVCVDAINPNRDLQVVAPIGHTQPIHSGASGLILLAYRPEEDVRNLLENTEMTALTKKTVTNRDEYRALLTGIREQGYAVLKGAVEKGTNAIAAPVFDGRKNVVASIVLRGPDVRMTVAAVRKMTPRVVEASARVSSDLTSISSGSE